MAYITECIHIIVIVLTYPYLPIGITDFNRSEPWGPGMSIYYFLNLRNIRKVQEFLPSNSQATFFM